MIYTSVTVAAITINEMGEEVKTVASSQYRTTAVIAFVACLIGAILFFFYNEKGILDKINALREEKA